MNYGKQICKSLKQVRRDIAKAAGINYEPAKCNHKGDCPGTCPQCEYELQMLEKEISRKRAYGKVALVAGLALGLSPLVAEAEAAPSPSPEKKVTKTRSAKPTNGGPKDPRSQVAGGIQKPRSYRQTAGMPMPPPDRLNPSRNRGDRVRPHKQNNSSNIDSTSVAMPDRLMGDVVAPVLMQPEFPGGEEAMLEFINKNLATPDGLTEEKTTVVVATVSNLDGQLSEIEVLESCGVEALDKEALRVVGLMPPFNVFVLKDEPLKATIPIVFTPKHNE